MVTRKINFIEGEYYHVYNRGNSKQKIFLDDKDRDRFVKLLFLCNSNKNIRFREDVVEMKIDAFDFDRGEQIVSIGAWTIMPNHFHIYITIPQGADSGNSGKNKRSTEENNISFFMRKLCTAYTMYFNKKHSRTGSLFEGRFKSVHVEDDIQAKYLFSYIHLNPIKLIQNDWKESGIKNKKEAVAFLNKYKWNSYKDYLLEKRSENKILNKKYFPEYFKNKKSFENEIFDWLELEKDII
jgi:REP element-mobilizing transposase RayT